MYYSGCRDRREQSHITFLYLSACGADSRTRDPATVVYALAIHSALKGWQS